jgi:hypothetical protein
MASTSRSRLLRSASARIPAIALLAALAAILAPPSARAQLSLEASFEHFDWHEQVTPIDVHETGPRFGGGASYLMPRDRGPLAGLRATVYGGAVDYDGSLQTNRNTAARGTTEYLGWTAGAEGRWRWPSAVDAVAALETNIWTRHLSTTQEEDFRVLSMRVGLDRPALRASRFTVGGGVRWLLAISERTTIKVQGQTLHLQLSPDPGWAPYVQAGYRFAPRFLAIAYWDGMQMGRSEPLVINTGGGSRTTVWQPETEVNLIGLRITFEP